VRFVTAVVFAALAASAAAAAAPGATLFSAADPLALRLEAPLTDLF